MKIAICEDHKIVADELTRLIKKYDHSQEIMYFNKPSALFQYMDTSFFDLIFMDLNFESEEEDGIKWLRTINKVHPHTMVIILTAYEERYKEGFEVRAFRFMSKPIIEQELIKYLEAVNTELSQAKSIMIKRKGIEHNLPIHDICYISAQVGGTELWTKKDMFPSEESLLHWANILPANCFFRCHNKYLVNLQHVKNYHQQEILLSTGEKIPISRRRWRDFQKAFMQYDTLL